jgi:hypothetical protein
VPERAAHVPMDQQPRERDALAAGAERFDQLVVQERRVHGVHVSKDDLIREAFYLYSI